MSDNGEDFFQRIAKGASNLFRGFLPFSKKITKLKVVTAAPPVEVHSTFSMLDLKDLQSHLKPSGNYIFFIVTSPLTETLDTQVTMASIDSFPLVEVNFSQLKRSSSLQNLLLWHWETFGVEF
jgi:hypothetical protein